MWGWGVGYSSDWRCDNTLTIPDDILNPLDGFLKLAPPLPSPVPPAPASSTPSPSPISLPPFTPAAISSEDPERRLAPADLKLALLARLMLGLASALGGMVTLEVSVSRGENPFVCADEEASKVRWSTRPSN